MRKSRTLARAALAAGTVLALAACGGSPTSSAGGETTESQAPGLAERPNRYRPAPMARSIWSGTISFG